MAKKPVKAAKPAKKAATKKAHNPHDSMVIQAGVVFIIVSAIIICSYAFSIFM